MMVKKQGWAVKKLVVLNGFNRPGQYSLSGQYYYFKWKIVNFVLFHIWNDENFHLKSQFKFVLLY